MLKNKIVLITGASSGIGAACAGQFAKAGAKLILCARRIEIINELSTLPEKFKNIDILINNAGLAAGRDAVQNADVNDWEEMINTNIKGLLYMTHEILPQMITRNAGHIINIGSIAGHAVYPNGAVYCATKFAVKALSEGLRMDLLGTNIRVSSVDPGAVETNFSNVRFKGDVERAAKVYEGFEPLKASDIADAILYCATRPAHVNVSEILIMPTAQVAVGMIARK